MMTEKAKNSKRKGRGINVQVVQEKKTTEKEKVRVNTNFEKKKSSKKKTTSSSKKITTKKSAIKATKKPTVKRSTTKRSTAHKTKTKIKVEASKETPEIKLPEVKIETEAKKAKTEAKVEIKTETKAEPEKVEIKRPASFSKTKKPEVILPSRTSTPNPDTSGFETLSLGSTNIYVSKIIPRDVTRNRTEIEDPKTLISTFKPEKLEEPAKTPLVIRKKLAQPRKLSAREIKEKEIEKAISSASRLPQSSNKRTRKDKAFGNFGWARLTLMITCITTAIFAAIYFMNLTSSDMSLKVAASQSGIEATYPDYIPRGYELSDVTSASGKVTMSFKSENGSFVITEESSTWNSNTLLNNYIKENYADDEYSVVVEQGLTIYMGTNWEAWVNGGLLYKLNVKTGSLTKKQLKTIATSL